MFRFFQRWSTRARKNASREETVRSQRRRLPRGEALEPRFALATYTWDEAANTLAVTLANNESLNLYGSTANAGFQIASGPTVFSQAGGNTASGSGTGFITIPKVDLTTSISITNSAATAGVNEVRVITNGTWSSGVINVALTDNDALGFVHVETGASLTASSLLSIAVTQSMILRSPLIATGAGEISLSANQQATPKTGSFSGIVFTGDGSLTADTGAITVLGRAGTQSGNAFGVKFESSTSRIQSNGAVRVEGTGGGDNGPQYNSGVFMSNGSIDAAGAVIVKGRGGYQAPGIQADSLTRITSRTSSVLVEGVGGGEYAGRLLLTGVIESLGTSTAASVTIRGATTSTTANAVYVSGATARVTSAGGSLLIEGTGQVMLSIGAQATNSGTAAEATVTVKSLTSGMVYLQGSGGRVSSARGAVTVDGAGGVSISDGAIVTSTGVEVDSTVTVKGNSGTTNGPGVSVVGTSQITSSGGAVLVEGSGGTDGVAISGGLISAGANAALTVKGTIGAVGLQRYGVNINSGGRIIADTTMLLVEGTGGVNVGSSQANSGTISNTGSVTLQALAATGGTGVSVYSGGKVTCGGELLVEGTAGGGWGVYVAAPDGLTAPGNVTVRGVGVGTGVVVAYGVKISSTGGAVLVEGTGGILSSGSNIHGVDLSGPVSATGSNGVTIRGTAGNGNSNMGVFVNGTQVSTENGPLLIEGTGGGSSFFSGNYGVGAVGTVQSTGTSSSATVTVRGWGGNEGVRIGGVGIKSIAGAILVEGTGGIAGNGNIGVNVRSGVIGGGDVTVRGWGGAGGDGYGVQVTDSGSQIRSTGGHVLVEGRGGSGGSYNIGVRVVAGGTITNDWVGGSVTVKGWAGGTDAENTGVVVYDNSSRISARGAVTVEGTGGGGGSGVGNVGVRVGSSAVIETASGPAAAVTIKGVGGNLTGSSFWNHGIYAVQSARIMSGGGPLILDGVAGSGTFLGSSGVQLESSTRVWNGGNTSAGTLSVTGTGVGAPGVMVTSWDGFVTSRGAISVVGTNASGTAINLQGVVNAGGGADITLTGDTFNLQHYVTTTGKVTLKPKTAGGKINVGGNDALSPLTMGLSSYELNLITTPMLMIGDATSGDVVVSAAITRSAATAITLQSAGAIQFTTGALNSNGGNVALRPGTLLSAPAGNVDVNAGAGTVTVVSGGMSFAINGTTVNTQYEQFNAAGVVDVSGVGLSLSGSYVPTYGQTFVLVNNDGADDIVGNFSGYPEGTTIPNFRGSGLTATLSYEGGDGNDVTLTMEPLPTHHVSNFAATASGVNFTLSAPAMIGSLNLYDYRNASGQFVLGSADVQLVNSAGQSIAGSLIIGSGDTNFTFVPTINPLPPETYTLTARSASDGFTTVGGELLDGDADGNPGGDFVRTFTVATPPANAVTVGLPNFARGPEQPVNIPADAALGLPIRVSNGNAVGSLAFDLRFDPGLLELTGVNLPAGVAGTATLTSLGAGHARVALTFTTPLSAGAQDVAYLQATVPSAAAGRYGEREVLDVSAIDLRNGGGTSLPALDQDAVHVNAYLGDAGRNGRYDSFDVQQASRLALRQDTGFQQHVLLDPSILADFNGNGRVDSFDVQRLSRLALRLPINEAPPLPAPLPPTTDTDRLTTNESKTEEKPAALRSDVDGNGVVDAQDILWAVYYLNRSSNGALPSEAGSLKLDLNGDQQFDPADLLLAITDLDVTAALLATDPLLRKKR